MCDLFDYFLFGPWCAKPCFFTLSNYKTYLLSCSAGTSQSWSRCLDSSDIINCQLLISYVIYQCCKWNCPCPISPISMSCWLSTFRNFYYSSSDSLFKGTGVMFSFIDSFYCFTCSVSDPCIMQSSEMLSGFILALPLLFRFFFLLNWS